MCSDGILIMTCSIRRQLARAPGSAEVRLAAKVVEPAASDAFAAAASMCSSFKADFSSSSFIAFVSQICSNISNAIEVVILLKST